MISKICQNCNKDFQCTHNRQKFCSLSCSNSFISRNRKLTESHKKNLILSRQKGIENGTVNLSKGEKHSIAVGKSTKGKFKNPQSILELSSRTITKIIKRMNLPCSLCSWNEAVCDIHHINGRKIPDADNHNNLTYICPNCHRKVHCGKIDKNQLITLVDYIGENWKDFYYG